MRFWLRAVLGAIVVGGIAVGVLSYVFWDQTVLIASMAINYVRYWSAPAGTIETEVAQTGAAQPPASTASASPQGSSDGTAGDWPSYNRTLTSNRFSQLSQINRTNADKLKVLCTYDTGQYTGFNSGLLEVNGALIFVTAFDIFSIDPSTCRENWRTHEDYVPATPQEVNRGAAYLDGICSAAPRTPVCLPTISRPANVSGKPRSGIPRRARAPRRLRSPGTAWFSSATQEATSRV
jgi:alcohol dehydrogenase (cytochrome c)